MRVSGPEASAIVEQMLARRGPLTPRHATFARVAHATANETVSGVPETGKPVDAVDQVIATYFPGPHSYTGEDVVEISGHGSPVLLKEIVRAAVNAGARLARPGEFTLRAFLNGRLDLIQAEAVADLIEAVTPLQARTAFDQLEGTLTQAIGEIERGLFDLIARLEASLDFPDEGYHFSEPQETSASIELMRGRVETLLGHAQRGRVIREGRHVAVVGKTNVGKSTLFNKLAGSERAIVTDVPGTTRDLLTERVDVGGIPVTLVDTAGIRATADVVESAGVARARGALSVADVSILVLDLSRPLDEDDVTLLDETDRSARLIVMNKSDLARQWSIDKLGDNRAGVVVSLKTGDGVERIWDELAAVLDAGEPLRDTATVTNIRHIELLERTRSALDKAAQAIRVGRSEEFVLADLQGARDALEEISGRRTTEDVLRHIFERFCIGK